VARNRPFRSVARVVTPDLVALTCSQQYQHVVGVVPRMMEPWNTYFDRLRWASMIHEYPRSGAEFLSIFAIECQ
jgi:hypothetical protein